MAQVKYHDPGKAASSNSGAENLLIDARLMIFVPPLRKRRAAKSLNCLLSKHLHLVILIKSEPYEDHNRSFGSHSVSSI